MVEEADDGEKVEGKVVVVLVVAVSGVGILGVAGAFFLACTTWLFREPIMDR